MLFVKSAAESWRWNLRSFSGALSHCCWTQESKTNAVWKRLQIFNWKRQVGERRAHWRVARWAIECAARRAYGAQNDDRARCNRRMQAFDLPRRWWRRATHRLASAVGDGKRTTRRHQALARPLLKASATGCRPADGVWKTLTPKSRCRITSGRASVVASSLSLSLSSWKQLANASRRRSGSSSHFCALAMIVINWDLSGCFHSQQSEHF